MSLGKRAFGGCRNLKELDLPQSLACIGDGALKGCRSLQRLRLSPATEMIGREAFAQCSSLAALEIPKEVQEIGAGAFDGCAALADEEGYVILDGTCYGCAELRTEIRVPASASRIAPGAFRDKEQILFLTVPPSVHEIGNHAFSGCRGMKEIRLPPAVRSLGPDAFRNCDSLESVIAPGMAPGQFERPQDRISAVVGFCRLPEAFEKKIRDKYIDWMNGNTVMILEVCVERNMPDAVRYFTENRLITREDHERILERAQRARAMEIVALLLNYRGTGLQQADIFDKYEL